jgi:hypothetical protein
MQEWEREKETVVSVEIVSAKSVSAEDISIELLDSSVEETRAYGFCTSCSQQ